jgi:hypothetical protein
MEGTGFTNTVYEVVVEAPMESVAVTEKGYAVGVATGGATPPSRPPPVRASHAGNPVAVSVTAPVPPLELRVCE